MIKQFVVLIMLLLISTILFSQIEIKDDSLELRGELSYRIGDTIPFTGFVYSGYPSGTLFMEAEYKDGLLDGKVTTYYNNEIIQSIEHYKAGKYHGKVVNYYPNGKPSEDLSYKNDYMNGPAIYYYENGNIQSRGSYDDCKQTGYWEYYYENGELKRTGKYNHALEEGTWTFFNPEGEIIKKLNYKDGKPVEQIFPEVQAD